ncbi:hypothetical protein PMAC_003397 [Pneumocystis sp. 'macacae']|nr:hypothetical protein PMAC_003397 [Pneumocystis sp. 'macacae']
MRKCTTRGKVCTKQRDECVHQAEQGKEGEVGCEKNVYRGDEVVCTKQSGGISACARCRKREVKNKVFLVNQSRTRNQVGVDEEVYEREGVHQVARYEVCAQSSEVGVYRADESVHQAVSGRRGGEVGVQVRVHRADKVGCTIRREGGEEVEVEVELD